MQYITAKQASERWNVTVRRVQDLCRCEKISGAVRWGRDWMIPVDAHRPADRRRKDPQSRSSSLPLLPKKNPAIVMSNLYQHAGSADAVAASLEDRPEAAALFRAQIAYCRGEIDTCLQLVKELLKKPCGHDLQIGCGIMLAMCAIYRGDVNLWKNAKQCILNAPCHHPKDHSLKEFWSAAMDSEIYDTGAFPDWFKRGCFDPLPGDSFPAARFYYLKYLYVVCHESATGRHGTPDSQAMMQMFPRIAEPLISQSRRMGATISEIYLRLVCAVAYHNLGNESLAIHHLDTAISLCLPDKLYLILAEYAKHLDFLMDERLNLQNSSAAVQVKAMSRELLSGWTHLHNTMLGRTVSTGLTTREREVAKHAAFGLSNKEIAARLHISLNTVKQSLRTAMDKTGAMRRNELSRYL